MISCGFDETRNLPLNYLAGLACEPCWFRERFRACARRIECLAGLDVQTVAAEVRALGTSVT